MEIKYVFFLLFGKEEKMLRMYCFVSNASVEKKKVGTIRMIQNLREQR